MSFLTASPRVAHAPLADVGWFAGLDPGTVVLLACAAALAGWVDAVVGGGGLIQLPALLLAMPGAAPVYALATNKIASIAGTSASALTYARRVPLDRTTVLWLGGAALLGAAGGAAVATRVPREAFEPIILVILVAVGAYTLAKPDLGRVAARHAGRRRSPQAQAALMAMTGAGIGFYDGAIGPGTGSFFVIALVATGGFTFLTGSAHAKFANVATNLAALVVFVPQGAVVWGLGVTMALANAAVGFVGARTAVNRGSGFVRVMFVLVVGALALRLGYGILTRG